MKDILCSRKLSVKTSVTQYLFSWLEVEVIPNPKEEEDQTPSCPIYASHGPTCLGNTFLLSQQFFCMGKTILRRTNDSKTHCRS